MLQNFDEYYSIEYFYKLKFDSFNNNFNNFKNIN